MGDLVKVSLKLDTSGLNAALRKAKDLSDRSSAYLVNKALFSIALKAKKAMPVTSRERIQSDMEKSAFVGKKNSSLITRLTAAQRIILASFYPDSKFNKDTGGVWKREKPRFDGDKVTRRLKFWEYVNDAAQRMVKARLKSRGFYRLGADVVKFIFDKNYPPVRLPDGTISTSEAQPGEGKVSKNIGRIAGGTRASGNGFYARAEFWVTTTEPDSKGKNTAISKLMQPIYQAAVDAEEAEIYAHAEKLYEQVCRDAGFELK